jgi:putative transposase
MKRKRFTEEQISYALRQAESGTPVAEICRKLGVSEQTFYRWKKKYGGMGVAELRRLKQLEQENRKLKQIVADLTLDKQMLQDVLKKSPEAGEEAKDGRVSPSRLCGKRATSLRRCWADPLVALLPKRGGPANGASGSPAGPSEHTSWVRLSSFAQPPKA